MAIYYIGIPLLMLTAVFDTTMMSLLRIWGGGPNLMLMVIVSWALLADIREALPWAILGGVFRDLLSVVPTGTSALALIIIVVAIDTYLPKLSWRNIVVPSLIVAAATLFFDLFSIIMLVLAGRPTPPLSVLNYVILPGLIQNALLILIVFRVLGSINAFLRPARANLIN